MGEDIYAGGAGEESYWLLSWSGQVFGVSPLPRFEGGWRGLVLLDSQTPSLPSCPGTHLRASLMAQMVKNLPAT